MLNTVSLVSSGQIKKWDKIQPNLQAGQPVFAAVAQHTDTMVPSRQAALALRAQIRFGGATPAPVAHPSVKQFEAVMQGKLAGKVDNFKLDPFQIVSMNHLAEGKSVMVSAPTSSGKTLVGNYMIERAVNPEFWPAPGVKPERHKVFYTAPRKAISNEKYRDFCAEYGKQNVGLMTGDITLNPQAPIILMTTEVLRNILYEEPEKMNEVGGVVFDECHFVNDRDRGPVWEESMIHMPKGVQQLHLSATVGNAQQYVDWMNTISTQRTELVYEGKRPVPLNYLFFNPNTELLEPLYKGSQVRGTFFQAFNGSSKGYDPKTLAKAMRKHKQKTGIDLGPSVATAFSKKKCNESFEESAGPLEMKKGQAKNPGNQTSPQETERLKKLRALIAEQSLIDPDLSRLNPLLITGLQHGYGIHHAGMTYAERTLVEKAQKAGLLDMVWATDTLGAGINTKQRTAVLTQFSKFDGEDYSDITPSDFHQIIGRAGRRGIFEPGYAVIVPPWKASQQDAMKILKLIAARPDRIESKFKPVPTMVLNLLKHRPVDAARDVMKQSFAAYQSGDPKQFNGQFNNTVTLLERMNLISKGNGGKRELTPLGEDLSKVPDTTFMAMYTMLKPLYTPTAELNENERAISKLAALTDWELVEMLSATLNERGDNPVPSANNSPIFASVANAFTEEAMSNSGWAIGLGVENQTPLNYNFSELITRWMTTGDWEGTRGAVEHTGLYIGDFMNVVRRTANLLDKMAEMKHLPREIKDKVTSAREKLLQAPIKESIQASG